MNLVVNGRSGVPTSAVAGVVVNMTVTDTRQAGFITVYPSGTAMPTASNLNYVPGQTIANLVMVKDGSNGTISITNNSSGTVSLLADIAGYFNA